jgi:ethanolamine utilization protein EutA
VLDAVKLIGLDFGTTTSSALVASARMTRSAVSGRVELAEIRECFRSEMIFTPWSADGRIDKQRLEKHLETWLAAGGVRAEDVFGGGALLTGLTAQADNAAALVQLIRCRLGDTLIAAADDPCLESWLAFMGSCAGLSRSRPDLSVLNLDIGGGTTNLAIGRAGEVASTGCLFVGSRHVQVVPGTYRIARLSRYAASLLEQLGIHKGSGDSLSLAEVDGIVDFYAKLLEAAALGRLMSSADPIARLHVQAPFRLPPDTGDLAVTFSGGVGELMYASIQGKPWPPTTSFGDLGIDLARRLVQAPAWLSHLRRYAPVSAGRATVYGLLRHATEVSGSTLFLPTPSILPLPDLPVLGTVSPASTDDQLREIFGLVLKSRRGGCVQVRLEEGDAPIAGRNADPSHEYAHHTGNGQEAARVRIMGGRLASTLKALSFPTVQPVVLLLRENVGKALGHYVTEWGALPVCVIVIDEVAARAAQYIHIGRPRDQVVPVSYYGLSGNGSDPGRNA